MIHFFAMTRVKYEQFLCLVAMFRSNDFQNTLVYYPHRHVIFKIICLWLRTHWSTESEDRTVIFLMLAVEILYIFRGSKSWMSWMKLLYNWHDTAKQVPWNHNTPKRGMCQQVPLSDRGHVWHEIPGAKLIVMVSISYDTWVKNGENFTRHRTSVIQ